jgi:structural maintenance of chromosome 2
LSVVLKENTRWLTLVPSVEKKEVALTKMLSTVLKDKEKIEETIDELDRYKRDALQKTWEKVNGYVSLNVPCELSDRP